MASLLDKLKEGALKYGKGALDELAGPEGPLGGVKAVASVPFKAGKKIVGDVVEGGKAIGELAGDAVENTVKRGNPLKFK